MAGRGLAKLALASLFVLGSAGAFVLFFRTQDTIRKMRMVRGEIPGAQYEEATVKSLTAPSGKSGGKRFMVHCVFEADGGDETHAINLPRRPWSELRVGETIRVARFQGDSRCYAPGGIWASDENLEFEQAMHTVEITAGILLGLIGLALFGSYFLGKLW